MIPFHSVLASKDEERQIYKLDYTAMISQTEDFTLIFEPSN
jgi:hypothetical protein